MHFFQSHLSRIFYMKQFLKSVWVWKSDLWEKKIHDLGLLMLCCKIYHYFITSVLIILSFTVILLTFISIHEYVLYSWYKQNESVLRSLSVESSCGFAYYELSDLIRVYPSNLVESSGNLFLPANVFFPWT